MRVLIGLVAMAALAFGADITGKWKFNVELDSGGTGAPVFELKQASGKLSGKYNGPLGERTVTGTVKGDTAVFGFEFEQDGQKLKATYTAKIESAAKMSGSVEFTGGGTGKWTAAKQ